MANSNQRTTNVTVQIKRKQKIIPVVVMKNANP